MSYAYRCPERGFPEFCDTAELVDCPHCGGTHEPYECGATEKVTGASYVPQPFHTRMDWALGHPVNSKSEKDRLYKAAGIREKSVSEHRRQHPGTFRKRGVTYSIAGQAGHKRTADPNVVVTKTGQRVV